MTRKARYVAQGFRNDPPPGMSYAGVVSRDSVRLGFLLAALNGLEILAGDVQNAFINAETPEKIFFYAGDEWGPDKGRVIIIRRALYGLKTSAATWRQHLADTITNMVFTASLADSEVFMKANSFGDGRVHDEYYTYIMVYVDDILIIDKSPGHFMDILKPSYIIKPDSIKQSTSYLGSDIGTVRINKTHYWTMSSQSYTKEAVKIV